jgi:PKD repeat protein
MPRRNLTLLVTLLLLLPTGAFASDFLLRVQRRGEGDLALLQSRGVPVLAELRNSLLVEGGPSLEDKLRRLDFGVEVLDSEPGQWDYLLAGLRPDSDLAALEKAGLALYTEDNLVLYRLWPGQDRGGLAQARAFLAPLPKEPLAPAAKADPLPSAPAGPEAAQPLVQQIVNGVSAADIDAYWNALVPPNPPGTGTRYTTSQGCKDAATYCAGVYQGLGLNTATQSYKLGYAPNVVATLPGAVNPGKVYIVIGHLDDMPSTGYAPGADDNASGSATVLAAAKAMSCYSFQNTVKFINVTGEETGLEGSTYYASDAFSRGEDIQGVLNFDMTGWAGDGSPPGENLDLNYDSNSQSLGLLYAQAASTYGTGLAVDAFLCPSLNASDHYPFWQKGWRAVCGITDNEGYCGHGGSYPYYHTSSDTLANCGPRAFFYSTVKATVATLAELAQPFKVLFASPAYGCSSTAQVMVGDGDLNASSGQVETAAISAWSTREPAPESVTVTEESADSPIFRGLVPLTTSAPVHGDGKVSVNPGDTVYALYIDALDCNGAAGVAYTATATVDCTGPAISDVQVGAVTESSAVVSWTTNEPADSRVTFGNTLPPVRTADVVELATSHSVQLTSLTPCAGYLFSVRSADAAGNATTDDNAGLYYTFSTAGRDYAFGPEDVESGPGSWTATGQWHVDACKFFSPLHAWKAGSTTCPGQYAASTDSYLTSPVFALGAPGHGQHLRYREWYNTESGYDWCTAQISTDGGSTWTTLGAHYAGLGASWSLRDFDLAAFSGANVRLRFWLHADGSIQNEGWYVDDIEVSRNAACALIPMIATAARSPSSGPVPLTVTFSGNATGGVPPYTYSWNFGDGSPHKTGATLQHTYATGGTYAAVLTVTDSAAPAQSASAAPLQVVAQQDLGASAEASPLAGVVPLHVAFSGGASGGTPPYAFAWDFGDGSPAVSGSTAEHTYDVPGTYRATLVVTDSASSAVTVHPDDISALAPLAASASGSPLLGVAPVQVAFTGGATGGSPPYTYLWDFGDGSATSAELSPSHTYAGAGDYSARLRVTDSAARTALSAPVLIHAQALLTCAAAADLLSGPAPLTVHLHAEASGGTSPYLFSWNFGDGSPAVLGADVNHTFTAGTYSVVLSASDSGSPLQQATAPPLSVRVDQPLAATATAAPGSGPLPLTVTYTAQASGGLPPYLFSWSFPDGSSVQTGESLLHTYGQAGSYTASLTVTDSAEPSQSLTVHAPAVTVTEQLSAASVVSPLTGPAPLAVTCQGSAAGGTEPYTFAWSFGDGATATGPSAEHVYTSPGLYAVSLTVTDSSTTPLTSGAAAQWIEVYAPLSAQADVSPRQGVAPLSVSASASHSGGKAPYVFTWDFGDGSPPAHDLLPPPHAYGSHGTYLIRFSVTDSAVPPATAEATPMTVTVFAPLTLSVSADPNRGVIPLAASFSATPSGGAAPYALTWNFGDGATATGTSANHTYEAPGVFHVSVQATDGAGQSTAASVTVTALAPLAASASASPAFGNAPLAAVLHASATGGSPPYAVTWDFGDGTSGTGATASHTYAAGTYAPIATVTDAEGRTARASTAVTAVTPPRLDSVVKLAEPFRLKLTGGNLHSSCEVRINGSPAPSTAWKSDGKIVAKGGSALKAMTPKGVPVEVTVVNLDDGGVSAPVTFTR